MEVWGYGSAGDEGPDDTHTPTLPYCPDDPPYPGALQRGGVVRQQFDLSLGGGEIGDAAALKGHSFFEAAERLLQAEVARFEPLDHRLEAGNRFFEAEGAFAHPG